jgi:hypothetical protein
MKTRDEQLKELDAELEGLQKNSVYQFDTETELKDFILETKAHQFAVTNLVCTILAKMNGSNLHSEKQRYDVFKKGRLIELLRRRTKKPGHTAQKPSHTSRDPK